MREGVEAKVTKDMREEVDLIFTPPLLLVGKMKIILELRSGLEIFFKN